MKTAFRLFLPTSLILLLSLSLQASPVESIVVSTSDQGTFNKIDWLIRTNAKSIEKKSVHKEEGLNSFCITFKEGDDSAFAILESDIEDMFLAEVSIEKTPCTHLEPQPQMTAGLESTQQPNEQPQHPITQLVGRPTN